MFRDEVVRARSAWLGGGATLPPGSPSRVLTSVSIGLAGALLAVVWFGTYSQKERVAGYIVPDRGVIRVSAHRAGTLINLTVRTGELVDAQQSLFTLISAADSTAAIDPDTQVLDRLIAERATLESRLEQENRISESSIASAHEQLVHTRRRIDLTENQLETAMRRVALLEQDVGRLESLRDRGHVAVNLLDARLGDLLVAQQQINELERQLSRLTTEASVTEAELHQLPLRHDSRISEIRVRLMTLERAIAIADAQWATVARAPVAGRVSATFVETGAALDPGRPVLEIVPAGSRMQAVLLVPTRAAGFLRTGQQVRIRYDAFPYQKFGLHDGHIVSISRTVLNAEDQTGPVRLAEPAYKLVIELASQSVRAYGGEVPLQPGLTLQADIVRDSRRIIEWLFDPLLATTRAI